MAGRYEIKMSLIVAQESLYQMKYIFEQLRNLYTDLNCRFFLRINIRYLVGNIRNWMLHSNATLYRGLTCLKKTSKILYYMKIMVCKISPGGWGAEPFLAIGLLDLKQIIGNPHISDLFKKVGYNLNIMRQTECHAADRMPSF